MALIESDADKTDVTLGRTELDNGLAVAYKNKEMFIMKQKQCIFSELQVLVKEVSQLTSTGTYTTHFTRTGLVKGDQEGADDVVNKNCTINCVVIDGAAEK